MIRINNVEYNGKLTKNDGLIIVDFEDEITVANVLEATELTDTETESTYALVHWREISYSENNKVTISWQTHFIDDVAQLRGLVEDLTSYYRNTQATKIEDIERRMNRYDYSLESLVIRLENLEGQIIEPQDVEPIEE